MPSFQKHALSGSTHGRGIKVAATSSPGTTIHTAVAGTDYTSEDIVTLFAYNGDSVQRTLTIQWGGTTSPDDDIVLTLPSKSGLTLVVADLILRNSLVAKAYADAANVVTIHGYVNRIA